MDEKAIAQNECVILMKASKHVFVCEFTIHLLIEAGTAELAGEGTELPVTIHSCRVTGWLISRCVLTDDTLVR